jgi:tetratricopeptide (TPR) repeat protein
VSRKHHDRKAHGQPTDLKSRVEKARHEGRYQQALELVKQLYKADPRPAHLELLKETYLDRGRQLHRQGYTRDAATTFEAAARVDAGNRAWLEKLAAEMAHCGEPARAAALLGATAGQPLPPAILASLADSAVTGDPRAPIRAELQADRDRILTAFALLEKGDEEGVRTALQEIGLRSPFLDWKLLVRGLQAYYQNDDARALDNWQRLAPERVPARLAAPFRSQIEPTFLAAQPHTTQQVLRNQFDRLQGSGLTPGLTNVRAALAKLDNLGPAFRAAEVVYPALRQQAPDLAARLITCFYWAITHTGPDDILRFQRVFGAPPDDPHFHRLRALANDRAPNFTEGHRAWHNYEKEIAAHPAMWGARANLARALIWQHMGQLATNIPSDAQVKKMPAALRNHPSRPQPLHPTAEECFQKSLELAPDLLETHEALFNHLLHDLEQPGQAEKVGRALLERFPNHVPTLEALARLRRDRGGDAEALALLERAVKHNPLDRGLRDKVGLMHLRVARDHTSTKDYDRARQHLQTAQGLLAPQYQVWVLCQGWACEIKAGQLERAEELKQQALREHPVGLEVPFLMLTEAIRTKLPPAIKKQYEKEFTSGLADTLDGATAAALARHLALFQADDVTYTGLKTHTNKILAYVHKIRNQDLPEALLITLCSTLALLKARPRAFEALVETGMRKYPGNPEFLVLHASHLINQGAGYRSWQVENLLERAGQMISQLPNGPQKDRLSNTIKELREQLEALNPFGGMMSQVMEMMGGMGLDFEDFFGDDEDEDDDDDDYWP